MHLAPGSPSSAVPPSHQQSSARLSTAEHEMELGGNMALGHDANMTSGRSVGRSFKRLVSREPSMNTADARVQMLEEIDVER